MLSEEFSSISKRRHETLILQASVCELRGPWGPFCLPAFDVRMLHSSTFSAAAIKVTRYKTAERCSSQQCAFCQCKRSRTRQASGGKPYWHMYCTCIDLNTHVHRQTHKYPFAQTVEKTTQRLRRGFKRGTREKSLETARRMHHSWEGNTPAAMLY